MTKTERWLTTIAFVSSVIPFILVVLFIKVLPQEIDIFEYENTNDPLLVGFLCVIPLAIVIAVHILKTRLVIQKSMVAPLSVSILLSFAFTLLVIYSMVQEISEVRELFLDFAEFQKLDFYGIASIIICLALAIYGNTLRSKKPENKLAIKNRFTKANAAVFKIVHLTTSPVITVGFAFVAVVLAFFSGWQTLLVPVIGIVLLYIWTIVFSYLIYRKIMSRAKQNVDRE